MCIYILTFYVLTHLYLSPLCSCILTHLQKSLLWNLPMQIVPVFPTLTENRVMAKIFQFNEFCSGDAN